jgi:hypothetical protein
LSASHHNYRKLDRRMPAGSVAEPARKSSTRDRLVPRGTNRGLCHGSINLEGCHHDVGKQPTKPPHFVKLPYLTIYGALTLSERESRPDSIGDLTQMLKPPRDQNLSEKIVR